MNWELIGTGFGLGTFKFLFSHWSAYWGFGEPEFITLIEIFIATTSGAWIAMAAFFYSSGYFMRRAAQKRMNIILEARKKGIEPKRKKIFTRTNKFIVQIKRSVGVYGITFLAPLLLSIPIGSIICAKFYGEQKKTFPLMLLFTATYSAIMCLLIFTTQ